MSMPPELQKAWKDLFHRLSMEDLAEYHRFMHQELESRRKPLEARR